MDMRYCPHEGPCYCNLLKREHSLLVTAEQFAESIRRLEEAMAEYYEVDRPDPGER
jgi:predicted metal-dependent hydrolase